MSRDEYERILGDLLDELPECFFRKLNLGVVISDRYKPHPQSRGDDLLVLGEYQRSTLGRQIVMYWPAFSRLYGHLSPLRARKELRAILRHEFRHHMEALAGENALELADMEQIRRYLGQGTQD